MKYKIAFFLLFTLNFAYAQFPESDVWMLDIERDGTTLTFSNPVNITNRPGYDNQPVFSPDGKYVLYASYRDNKQSDIYKYDMVTKTTSAFTNTPESEFSPTFTPDKKFISVVRVQMDSVQRLWKFPLTGTDPPSVVLSNVDSVGYHVWMGKDSLALFILTKPFTLQVVDVKKQRIKIISDSIGRCIQNIPSSSSISFTKMTGEKKYKIFKYSRRNHEVYEPDNCRTCILPEGTEDYVWYNKSLLFTASGSQLLQSCQDCSGDWVAVADLKSYGIEHITRMALSPTGDRLLIVSNK